MKYNELELAIKEAHSSLQQNTIKAINRNITIRNWLIGYYIVEFEQKGEDRAKYGLRLLKSLEESINTKGLNETLFKWSRIFYNLYPSVEDVISATLSQITDLNITQICATSHESINNNILSKSETLSHELQTPHTDIFKLISNLSFSHIRELLVIDDKAKRFFYETECIKGNWSVRELRRQINTLLYERSGMSKNSEKLIQLTNENIKYSNIEDIIRQPFTFEFLGLKAKDVVEEKDIETALLNNLQEFLLELGYGFCFEARQKRIIIDDEYYFADLVFYHRILHCHVIIELKNDEFRHEHIGQLNAYVSYYKETQMQEGDNPPIGILLCTHKGEKMVEYAIANLENKIFVSQYLLKLPSKEQLENFIITHSREIQ